MKVLYGYDIPESLYGKIADLDAEVFSEGAEEFVGNTTMPKEVIISLLKKNISMTVVMVDDSNNVIAYYQSFPIEKEFAESYLKGDVGFSDINETKVLESNVSDITMYLWTIAVKKEYRGVKVDDIHEPGKKVSIIQLLQEGLVDCLIDLRRQGVVVKRVMSEGVSEKGVDLVKSFCGEDSLVRADEENAFYVYASNFNPDCRAFSRCRNIHKLKVVYGQTKGTSQDVVLSDGQNQILSLKDDSNVPGSGSQKNTTG